ncbi:MAG TPA: hypothetical protein VIS48_05840 [Candidatus Kryptonia bacterium]
MINAVLMFAVLFAPHRGPEFYYFDGKVLSPLYTINLPNLGTADIHLFVKSTVEPLGAVIDSSEIEICIPTLSERNALGLAGSTHSGKERWYKLSCAILLKVGVTRHTVTVTSRAGTKYTREFLIAVEGTKKLERPFQNK